jgi:outer membrane protein TolC
MATAREEARDVAAAEARWTASRERLREARGYRLPTVRLEEVWMRTDSPAEAFALTLNQERFSFADFVAGDPNRPDPVESATTRFEASLPLYTGGEISGRVHQAELGAEAAQGTADWTRDAAALAAAGAWVRLAQAREQVALLERSLETVEAHVALARSYTDQGMLVRSELLRAEVERARVQDLLTEARGNARLAENDLSFRIGAPLGGSWELPALPPPPAWDEGLEGWLATAGSRRDLDAARSRVAAAELEPRVVRAGALPRVGVVARYDLVDDTPFGSHGNASAVMAMVSLDLFDGGRRRAASAAAAAEAAAARSDVDRFAEAVRLEVRQAYERAITARDRRATAAAAVAAAQESERITEARFRQGVVKTLDVLDAATARREAETRELVARAEAHLAAFQLATTAGRPPESMLPTAGPQAHPTPAVTSQGSESR